MGLLGVALGALATVAGTWWVSNRLDRQKDHRQLVAAIGIVALELEANSQRISAGYRREDLRQRLTLGDWASNKNAFAGVALRNRALWKRVADTYEAIYQFRAGWRDDHPTSDRLNRLVVLLHGEERALGREKGRSNSYYSAPLNWVRSRLS